MSFIDKIKIENTDYDIQDTEARKQINECLKTESDPTVPAHVKAITEEKITEWNNKSNFSGNYSDLTGIPSEFKPSTHNHKMSDITDYKEPDLSDYALKKDIPTNYITEIPSEYITEDELNKALENMPSGSAIPEITENTNIYDLETGIYYVNPQIVLTYSNTNFSEEQSLTVFVKSILIVEKAYVEDEVGEIYYQLIGIDPTIGTKIVGVYHGYIELIIGFYPLAWNGLKPKFMSMDSIEALTDKVTQITSSATDEQYPSAKAVYDYVNSAIGTALDGEY